MCHRSPCILHSLINAFLLEHGRRFPYICDPDQIALQYLMTTAADTGLYRLSPDAEGFADRLRDALQYGHTLILEGPWTSVPPLLGPLLDPSNRPRSGRRTMQTVTLGDGRTYACHPTFCLYILSPAQGLPPTDLYGLLEVVEWEASPQFVHLQHAVKCGYVERGDTGLGAAMQALEHLSRMQVSGEPWWMGRLQAKRLMDNFGLHCAQGQSRTSCAQR